MTKIKSSDAIIFPLSSLCSFVQYKKVILSTAVITVL